MSRKRRKRPIQKRSFLLFELLVSMGLLLLCLAPLIKTHVGIAKAELKELRAIQKEQEVEAKFCTIKTKLYEHVHSWKELMGKVEGEGYTLRKIDQSTKNNSESGLILSVTFNLGKDSYERTIYVKKTRSHPH